MKKLKPINNKIIWLISVGCFFLGWQLMSQQKIIDPIFFGTPTKMFTEGMDLFRSGEIYENLANSLGAFFVGLSWALIIGIVGGLIVGTKETVYRIIQPYVYALNTIPPIVLLPFIILWFGIGLTAKTVVVFLMAVTPIFISTYDASRTVDQSLKKMAKSFGASNFFVLRSITLFHSLPYIFSAMRVAIGRSTVAVIITEFFGFGQGIGYLISFYSSSFRMDRAMALVVMVVIFNFGIIYLLDLMEKRLVTWKNN